MEKSKKKKIIVWSILTPVLALSAAFLVLCIVTMCMFSPNYLGRVLTHWDSSVSDIGFFPARAVVASEKPYAYERVQDPTIGSLSVFYSDGRESHRAALDDFAVCTDTTSFLIVRNDKLIYEKYADGMTADSVQTSFSMSKSVVSLLIGRAVEDGYIADIRQPISNYISEFVNTEIGKTTVEDLLAMRSRISYEENGFLWFGDDSLTYWHPDLRKLALEHRSVTDAYGGKFHYNNYHPLLLGLILERTTGMSVSAYFEREIWRKVGAEFAASWSLDSEESGFEKMESGINFRAVDFVKIGSAVLHGGEWNGERIIGEEWLNASTLCPFPFDTKEYENTFLAGKNIGYRYMWYTVPSRKSGFDIVAWGKSDQVLYISPANDTVILRTGRTDGGVADWVNVMQNLTEALVG